MSKHSDPNISNASPDLNLLSSLCITTYVRAKLLKSAASVQLSVNTSSALFH
jgi:hypothetical protein